MFAIAVVEYRYDTVCLNFHVALADARKTNIVTRYHLCLVVDLCGLGRDNCLFNHCSCERIVRYIPAINAKENKYICFDIVDLLKKL